MSFRWLLGKWKSRKFCRKKPVKVEEEDASNIPTLSYVQREESKADLGDFTLGEYTEKVIVYGFLMVRFISCVCVCVQFLSVS